MPYRPYGDQIAMRNAVIRAGGYSHLSHLGARAAMGIGKRLGQAYNNYRKRSSAPVNNASASSPTTFQNDRIRTFRKKRPLSRRKLRRVKRFERSVSNVLSRNLGQRFMVTSPYFGVANIPSGEQTQLDFPMAAGTGNVIPDLEKLWSYFNTTSTAYTNVPGVLRVDAMTNEVRLRNVSGSGIGVTIDLYYYVTRKNLPAGEDGSGAKYISALAETPPFQAGGTQFDYTTLGITPFNASQWCNHFLITKVVRVDLADGQETTFKLVTRRPMRIQNDAINDFAMLKGVSKGVLAIPRAALSSTGGGQASVIAWSSIRTYRGQHMSNALTSGAVV